MTPNLPEDHQAERSLLACLAAPGAGFEVREILAQVQEADFVAPAHRYLLAGIRALTKADTEVHLLTLRDELRRAGKLDLVGGVDGLVDILQASELGRPKALLGILQRHRRRRELLRLGAQIQSQAEAEETNPEDILDQASQGIHRIAVDGEINESRSWLRILEQVASGDSFGPKHRNVIRFGIPTLDDQIVTPPGGTILVGARPGIGKTAFLTQAGAETARAGERVLLVQLELPAYAQEARLAGYLTRTRGMSFREGGYHPKDACFALSQEGDALGRGWIVSPNQGTPWPKIEAEIRRHKDRHGITVAMIDYFSLIGRPSVGRGSSEAYAYASVSEGITALAKELQIGILLLAQLTKDADGGKPNLRDFADSDRPSRDCWASLLLWRDKEQRLKAWLSKNRDGAIGWERELNLDGATNRFREVINETSPGDKFSEKFYAKGSTKDVFR